MSEPHVTVARPGVPAALAPAGLGVLSGALFLALSADRMDYVGHYLLGFGMAVLVLTLLAAAGKAGTGSSFLGLAIAALAGVGLEATVLHEEIFDVAAVADHGLGAVIATALALETERRFDWTLILIAAAFVAGGWFLATA